MKVYAVRYLKYWWDRKSIINPKDAERNYYEVFYDHKGRRVRITTYSKTGEVLGYQNFHWKGSWLVQAEDFSPDNAFQHKKTYHYNKFGFLLEERLFAKDGTFLGNGLGHERDVLDFLNQWLSDLIGFPVVEATGLINYIKGLFEK